LFGWILSSYSVASNVPSGKTKPLRKSTVPRAPMVAATAALETGRMSLITVSASVPHLLDPPK
jgi:hypothetical protein